MGEVVSVFLFWFWLIIIRFILTKDIHFKEGKATRVCQWLFWLITCAIHILMFLSIFSSLFLL
jgi:hypothetical protein